MGNELWLEIGYKEYNGYEDMSWYNEGRTIEIFYFMRNFIKYLLGSGKQLRQYFKLKYGKYTLYYA